MTLESTTCKGAHRLRAKAVGDVRGAGERHCSAEAVGEHEGGAARWTPMAVEGAWAKKEQTASGGGGSVDQL
jgi:hypothetical protein